MCISGYFTDISGILLSRFFYSSAQLESYKTFILNCFKQVKFSPNIKVIELLVPLLICSTVILTRRATTSQVKN
jgi:hypothetical protein